MKYEQKNYKSNSWKLQDAVEIDSGGASNRDLLR